MAWICNYASGFMWGVITHTSHKFNVNDVGIWAGKSNNIPLFYMDVITYPYPGGWFNIKMSSYQYRKSHCGDKTVVRSSYLHNGISYTGKMSSLYWIGAQILMLIKLFFVERYAVTLEVLRVQLNLNNNFSIWSLYLYEVSLIFTDFGKKCVCL